MGPSARNTAAAGRGLVLVVVAVAIGLLLLRQVDSGDDGTEVAAGPDDTAAETTEVPATTLPPDLTVPDGTEVPATTAPAGGGETTAPPTTADPGLEMRDRSLITVLVANGNTGVNGAAGRLTETVGSVGYVTAEATNTNDGQTLQTSVIRYEAGYAAEANRLAEDLGWPANDEVVQPMGDAPPVDALDGANLLVLLGVDRAA